VDEAIEGVGRQLRLLRKGRSLTLAQLAERAGCTDGYLSAVENGATVPTLSSIAALAAALGHDLTAFFPTAPRERVHVHRAMEPDRLRIASSAHETYTILSARSAESAFTGLLDEVEPSEDETSRGSFFGERFLLVLSGDITLRIGGTTHALGPGATLHYSSHPDHLLRVTSESPALLLWVVTPALL
jgi:transcriptional regulator with XRE-family HTH domain